MEGSVSDPTASTTLWSGWCVKRRVARRIFGGRKRWCVVDAVTGVSFYKSNKDTRAILVIAPNTIEQVEMTLSKEHQEMVMIAVAGAKKYALGKPTAQPLEQWNQLEEAVKRLIVPWGKWTKLDHKRFPERTRREIWHFLLITTREWRGMPRDLRYVVIGFIATRGG